MAKRKRTKVQTTIYKILHRKLTQTTLITGDELGTPRKGPCPINETTS